MRTAKASPFNYRIRFVPFVIPDDSTKLTLGTAHVNNGTGLIYIWLRYPTRMPRYHIG